MKIKEEREECLSFRRISRQVKTFGKILLLVSKNEKNHVVKFFFSAVSVKIPGIPKDDFSFLAPSQWDHFRFFVISTVHAIFWYWREDSGATGQKEKGVEKKFDAKDLSSLFYMWFLNFKKLVFDVKTSLADLLRKKRPKKALRSL